MGSRFSIFIILIVFFTIFSAKLSFSNTGRNIQITDIIVQNNQRIDKETILTYLGIEPGDKVNYQILNKKLKEMYGLGLFADIKFRVSGDTLIVLIKENPMINNIDFIGNKRIKEDAMRSEIKLKSRNVYQKSEVQDTIALIRDLYKRSGYFSAKIKAQINRLSQNRIDITFRINEGEKTKIKGVKFIGNKIFSDKRLKGVISTKESKLWRIMSAGDIYDPDRINYDKDLLRRYYLQEGYADFKIISAIAELTKDKSGFFVTFSLDEGERYKFG